jgi:hypothetical protein
MIVMVSFEYRDRFDKLGHTICCCRSWRNHTHDAHMLLQVVVIYLDYRKSKGTTPVIPCK